MERPRRARTAVNYVQLDRGDEDGRVSPSISPPSTPKPKPRSRKATKVEKEDDDYMTVDNSNPFGPPESPDSPPESPRPATPGASTKKRKRPDTASPKDAPKSKRLKTPKQPKPKAKATGGGSELPLDEDSNQTNPLADPEDSEDNQEADEEQEPMEDLLEKYKSYSDVELLKLVPARLYMRIRLQRSLVKSSYQTIPGLVNSSVDKSIVPVNLLSSAKTGKNKHSGYLFEDELSHIIRAFGHPKTPDPRVCQITENEIKRFLTELLVDLLRVATRRREEHPELVTKQHAAVAISFDDLAETLFPNLTAIRTVESLAQFLRNKQSANSKGKEDPEDLSEGEDDQDVTQPDKEALEEDDITEVESWHPSPELQARIETLPKKLSLKEAQLKHLKKLADLTDAAIVRGEVYTEFQKDMTYSFASRSRNKFSTFLKNKCGLEGMSLGKEMVDVINSLACRRVASLAKEANRRFGSERAGSVPQELMSEVISDFVAGDKRGEKREVRNSAPDQLASPVVQ